MIFSYSCSVHVLDRLVQALSLRQHLPKALRLWVILQSIYGDPSDELTLNLPEVFTYNQWRDQFFITTTNGTSSGQPHRRDISPPLHDRDCRCARSMRYWLFESSNSVEKKNGVMIF